MVYEDTAEARDNRSDRSTQPLVWCVYILELVDGGHYVGQTDDLKVRLSEHAMGSGGVPELVWFSQLLDHEGARSMEARLKRAVERRPDDVGSMIDRFQDLVRLIVPEQALEQVQEESRVCENEAGRSCSPGPLQRSTHGPRYADGMEGQVGSSMEARKGKAFWRPLSPGGRRSDPSWLPTP